MAIKITKAEYDALPDSLKAKFEADGDGYQMVEEDVEGLKKSKADILREKKELQDKLADLEKFKTEHEAAANEAAQKELEAAGKYKEALAEREKAWQERDAEKEARINSILGNLHRERLQTELTKRGVLPDRVSYIAGEFLANTEFVESDGGFVLKKKGGIGDAAEFEAMIEAAKKSTPFFFAPNGASGSGASGSGGSTAASGNTMPKSQWDTLDVKQQAAFIRDGGRPVD